MHGLQFISLRRKKRRHRIKQSNEPGCLIFCIDQVLAGIWMVSCFFLARFDSFLWMIFAVPIQWLLGRFDWSWTKSQPGNCVPLPPGRWCLGTSHTTTFSLEFAGKNCGLNIIPSQWVHEIINKSDSREKITAIN